MDEREMKLAALKLSYDIHRDAAGGATETKVLSTAKALMKFIDSGV
jgi:hypothetical protein